MGNGCSAFKFNKACLDGDINIKEEEDLHNHNSNNNINNIVIKNKNNKKNPIKKKITISSNGINIKNENKNEQDNKGFQGNFLNLAPQVQNQDNSENEICHRKSKKSSFTNLMEDLDISFNKNIGNEQNDVFNINYIKINEEYNNDIIDYLNKIRTEPKTIINDIDNLLNEGTNNSDNKLRLESDKTHEIINLEDGGEAFNETKDFLNNINPIETKFDLNEDLLIDISESEKNMDSPLEKKIEKIIMNKKKNIIKTYPNCQFFINFIKDIKIGLLFLLSQKGNISNFRNILFNNKFKYFNITWIKEKKLKYR